MTTPDPNVTTTPVVPTPPEPDAPWGEDENFDADKAKKLISNLRGENTKLKSRPALTDEHREQLAELEKLRTANQSELEKAQGELTRWQTEADTWRKAAVGSTIQALATDFADPTDAVTALSERNYLDAGGQIDEAAIRTDLAALLEAKQHWRKPADLTPRAPSPNGAQGKSSGSTSTDPAQQFAAIMQGSLQR